MRQAFEYLRERVRKLSQFIPVCHPAPIRPTHSQCGHQRVGCISSFWNLQRKSQLPDYGYCARLILVLDDTGPRRLLVSHDNPLSRKELVWLTMKYLFTNSSWSLPNLPHYSMACSVRTRTVWASRLTKLTQVLRQCALSDGPFGDWVRSEMDKLQQQYSTRSKAVHSARTASNKTLHLTDERLLKIVKDYQEKDYPDL